MRRHRLAIVAFAIVALAGFAIPGFATAKPHGHTDRTLSVEVQTRGSHGYRISVYALGSKHVEVLVDNGPFTISYEVPGHITRRELKANLGKFGRISLHFHVTSTKTESIGPAGNCPEPRLTEEHGVFRGTFDFKGEQGFTTVATHRAGGRVDWSTVPQCHPRRARASAPRAAIPPQAGALKYKGTADLIAENHSEERDIEFEASRDFPGLEEEWILTASVSERRGRIGIEREAFLFAHLDSVLVSGPGDHPAAAEVTAVPKPLQGSATFQEDRVAPALPWEGSLNISFPGIGRVALAGEGFQTTLCSEKTLDKVLRCGDEAGTGVSGP